MLSTRRNIACVPAAGLEQWEQEVKLFVALKQLRLFRQHKLWKAFKCWKSAIDSTKLAAAKVSLNKQLFLLSPVFQQPLQQFHALCHELSSMRLHSIQPGKVSSVVAGGPLCRAVSLEHWPDFDSNSAAREMLLAQIMERCLCLYVYFAGVQPCTVHAAACAAGAALRAAAGTVQRSRF